MGGLGGGRTGFLPALSGLVPNSPPPSGSSGAGTLAFDQHEEGTPVGRGGSGSCQESEDSSITWLLCAKIPTDPTSLYWSSLGDILGQYYPLN